MTERSILAAVSGIDANQTYLDSIGNNIANADTVGYKDSEVQFQDLLSEQISGASAPTATAGGVNPVAIGSGVAVAANEVNLQEGSLEQTGNPSDVAIQGNGYLIADNNGAQEYTRDGSLTVDANGNLTTQEGQNIMGWQASSAGTVDTNAPITAIKIPQGETIGASPTGAMTLGGNLDATATTPETTTVDAYDSLGNVVPVTLTFTPPTTTGGPWTYAATVPGSTTPIISGSAQFTNGELAATGAVTATTGTVTTTAGSYTVAETWPTESSTFPYSFPAAGGTPPAPGSQLLLTFPAATSADSVTAYASAQTIHAPTVTGYASGTLESYSIAQDGTITGSFSNGQTQTLGQIALANFANASGLADQGGGLYATSANSGQAQVGVAGTGGLGALLGGELEQSNVDLGGELTELMTAQEAYTANTKVLSTSDQVIQALENVP